MLINPNIDKNNDSLQNSDMQTYESLTPVDLSNKKKTPNFCGITEDEETILSARQLVAKIYKAEGYIKSDEIDENGVIVEPHASHSSHYVFTDDNGEIVSTVRKTRWDPALGEESFPLWKYKSELDEEYVNLIKEIGLENIVEIGAFAKDSQLDKNIESTMFLYRKLIQDAWEQGHERAFIMAFKPALFRFFKMMFNGSVVRIGPDIEYPGERVIPALLSVSDGPIQMIEHVSSSNNKKAESQREVLKFMLTGAKADLLDRTIITTLIEKGYDDVLEKLDWSNFSELEASDVKKLSFLNYFKNVKKISKIFRLSQEVIIKKTENRKIDMLFMAGLLGYTALRTAYVATAISPNSHVKWPIFLGIELATTPTYTWGMGDLARHIVNSEKLNNPKLYRATLSAAGSFLAPYVYLGLEGQGVSKDAIGGMIGLFGIGIISGGIRLKKNVSSMIKTEKSIND